MRSNEVAAEDLTVVDHLEPVLEEPVEGKGHLWPGLARLIGHSGPLLTATKDIDISEVAVPAKLVAQPTARAHN